MKYCAMSIEKTLFMYRVCIIKRPRETWLHLTEFLIKKNNISRLFKCLQNFREYCLPPQKMIQWHCSFMHTFENTFPSMQMQGHGPIIWAKPNWTCLIFTIDFIYQSPHYELDWSHGFYLLFLLFFLQPRYLQRYAKAGKGRPLCNWFGFVDGAISRILRPVLNGNVLYSRYTWVHGVKFQSVVSPNGLIIKLEG